MLRALEEPLRCIVSNAGEEPSVVLNKVVEGKGNYGYNAQTEEYGDLMEMGVVDPTKVARIALQNAASVAGLILTTAAMVAESPQEEAAAAAMVTVAWVVGWVEWVAWACKPRTRAVLSSRLRSGLVAMEGRDPGGAFLVCGAQTSQRPVHDDSPQAIDRA